VIPQALESLWEQLHDEASRTAGPAKENG
jgi:hypothetical protein